MKGIAISLFLWFLAHPIAAACITAPDPFGMILLSTPRCDLAGVGGCPTNVPIPFELHPYPSGYFPPSNYDPGYTVQPCDTVTWNFGDGTPEVVVQGSNKVEHTFTDSANVSVTATVSNAAGSATAQSSVVIADDPIRVKIDDAIAYENAPGGTFQLQLHRTGGMSRTGTFRVYAGQLYDDPPIVAAVGDRDVRTRREQQVRDCASAGE
jgi:hypothetical protein